MTVEQIQELIASSVKIQLGGDARKNYIYTKPYTKRVDATNLQNSNNLTGRATQNSMWHISLRHVTMLHERRPNDKIVRPNTERYIL